MADIPKIAQRRLQAAAKPGVHLDPDLLTGFTENVLAGRERAQVLQHLAQCASCRDVVSLALPEVERAQPTKPMKSTWLSWPVLRWGALAACAVVVVGAVTLRRELRQETVPVVEQKVPPSPAPPVADLVVEGKASSQQDQKLTAKIAPPQVARSDRDFAVARQLAKQREDTRSSAASTMKGMKPLRSNQPASSETVKPADSEPAPQMAAVTPPSAPVPKAANEEAQAKERNGNFDYAAGASSQTVTLQAESVQVAEAAKSAPSKMKDESRKKVQNARAGMLGGMALGDRQSGAAGTTTETVSAEDDKLSHADNKTAPRWTLSPDGTLQRSLDSGQTWQTIPVASAVTFRALSANESDIWVGGAAGALYHSSDAGQHWAQVTPVADGTPLTADIITVQFADSHHGKLITDDHQTWTTTDAGRTWHSQ